MPFTVKYVWYLNKIGNLSEHMFMMLGSEGKFYLLDSSNDQRTETSAPNIQVPENDSVAFHALPELNAAIFVTGTEIRESNGTTIHFYNVILDIWEMNHSTLGSRFNY
jgi:hypothetical protein